MILDIHYDSCCRGRFLAFQEREKRIFIYQENTQIFQRRMPKPKFEIER